jgi:hypothetical protein
VSQTERKDVPHYTLAIVIAADQIADEWKQYGDNEITELRRIARQVIAVFAASIQVTQGISDMNHSAATTENDSEHKNQSSASAISPSDSGEVPDSAAQSARAHASLGKSGQGEPYKVNSLSGGGPGPGASPTQTVTTKSVLPAGDAFEAWCLDYFGKGAHAVRMDKERGPFIMGDIYAAFLGALKHDEMTPTATTEQEYREGYFEGAAMMKRAHEAPCEGTPNCYCNACYSRRFTKESPAATQWVRDAEGSAWRSHRSLTDTVAPNSDFHARFLAGLGAATRPGGQKDE